MSRPLQSAGATHDQIAGLDAIADRLGVNRGDFGQPVIGQSEIRTSISHEEGRELGRLAFELDTSVAALARAAIRSMMRKVKAS